MQPVPAPSPPPRRPPPTLLLLALAAAAAAAAAPRAAAAPPDTSLATFPTAFYGALWGPDAPVRSDALIANMSRASIVILMQMDGTCWKRCCPASAGAGAGAAAAALAGFCNASADATLNPGCDAACDQEGQQRAEFARIRAAALARGAAPPHLMLYVNAVYLWPFDAAANLSNELVDVNGRPHEESNDPGLYPSYFWSFDKPAAAAAWVDNIRRALEPAGTAADGVYVDCYADIPFKCDPPDNATCIAKRNGRVQSVNEVVTAGVVQSWAAGKALAVAAGAALTGDGAYYAKEEPTNAPPPHGGTMTWLHLDTKGAHGGADGPSGLIAQVQAALVPFKYVVIGIDWNNQADNPGFQSLCTETAVALFLLAAEPGAFCLCQGYDERFALPLGAPLAPAACDAEGTWSRTFKSGTRALYFGGNSGNLTGMVEWAPSRR